MSDFFDDYLNEIHDEEIAKNLRGLKKEYNAKLDDIINQAGRKVDMASAWEKLTHNKTSPSTQQDHENLVNSYKLKAMNMAQPGIEDENKFKELVKRHSPALQAEADPPTTVSHEHGMNQKEQARQKFKEQFKTNGKDIQIEKD